MKRAIITGADGFVGSYTTGYFLQRGAEVLALDLPEKPNRLRAQDGLIYKACDISNTDVWMREIPRNYYDMFIHFAWAGSAGPGRVDYKLQMKNALTTVECLKAAKALGCRRFVCSGSIMEYEVEAAVHAQGTRPGMAYIYGMGKHIAHSLCKAVAADTGIDLLWPIITNAYGPGETSPRFINSVLRKIINGEPLQFTAATQNYDFVFVTDVARAFYLIAQNGRPFCEYVIGSGNARPLKEFIMEMQRTLAPEAVLQFGNVPFTGTNLPISVFDTTMTKKDCGFIVETSFDEGIRKTMDWLVGGG